MHICNRTAAPSQVVTPMLIRPGRRDVAGRLPLLCRMFASVEQQHLTQGQPNDVTRTVATFAMSRLVEGVRQFPLLRFVAPLSRRVRYDIVRTADGANRRRPRCSPYADKSRRLLLQVEGVEKRCVSHIVFRCESDPDPVIFSA
jgi:hypothetical protein